MTAPEPTSAASAAPAAAALVTAYLGGDRDALGALYDRFAPALYDTAAAMLRDPHEAADVVQDTFLVAAERMGQLRDPERIKAWLFAIARHEIYRRTKRRRRFMPSDKVPEMAAPQDALAEGAGASHEELAALVREAAMGLDERDQLVLELSVRQGLQGADLADALGVTPEQSYTLVHRMRERVERTIGAVLVARQGRRDCDELRLLLSGWDGTFTVLWRKRISRHVEDCDTCERTRRKAAPLALFGSAPAFALPVGLRDTVLQKAGAPAPTGTAQGQSYRFDAKDGFPGAAKTTSRLVAALVATIAAIALVVGGVVLLLGGGDDDSGSAPTLPTSPAVTAPATTGAATAVPVTSLPALATAPAPPPTPTSPPSPPSTTSTTLPVPGELTLSTTDIDFGTDGTSATVSLTNSGTVDLDWTRGDASPFVVTGPAGGALAPGESVDLTVSVDRDPLHEGPYLVVLPIRGDDPGTIVIGARVERGPVVRITDVNDSGAKTCVASTITIKVAVTDESPITSVRGRWEGPAGSEPITFTREGSRWRGTIVKPSGFGQPNGGDYDLVVTATDSRGNRGADTDGFSVEICPQ